MLSSWSQIKRWRSNRTLIIRWSKIKIEKYKGWLEKKKFWKISLKQLKKKVVISSKKTKRTSRPENSWKDSRDKTKLWESKTKHSKNKLKPSKRKDKRSSEKKKNWCLLSKRTRRNLKRCPKKWCNLGPATHKSRRKCVIDSNNLICRDKLWTKLWGS